ncbi:zinc dependent phospholipase C family protein [Paenibacillus spongiae]|uniref:Zinc dependent phospholipase C family protein n=1 Tax=Paenibacillus spongiae TaxID=2909671 RepID=A0ABY5S443_9BACL|nr:zinc dependent phospholipase C family protein [Paenibacillus spongiae]UVI28681.1 zinc dependent phospholipase C family protein [Paenibacillus spongiae]
MPNIWTHFIFGQKVLQSLGEDAFLADDSHRRLFNMGCQGPDFLFYRHFLPWQRDKTMNKLGSEMHNRHCGHVMMDLLDAVCGRSASSSAPDRAVVYTLGFLLHHILDRNMHPYVFSRSGFRKWDHQRFEVIMDTLIARKLLGIETWRTEVWREINIKAEKLPETVVDAFEQVTAVYYDDLAPAVRREDWDASIRDMIHAQRLFHDPTGIRRKLTFGQIEPLVYKRELPPLDILNEAELPWLDPVDGKQAKTDSVWTLWDAAMEDGIRTVTAVLKWLREEEQPDSSSSSEKFSQRATSLREAAALEIGNLSYETGLPCDSGAAIRYEDPIWPDRVSSQISSR